MDNLGPQPERARIKINTFVPDSLQSITGLYVCGMSVCLCVYVGLRGMFLEGTKESLLGMVHLR